MYINKMSVIEYMSSVVAGCPDCGYSRMKIEPCGDPEIVMTSKDNVLMSTCHLELEIVCSCNKCRVVSEMMLIMPLDTLVAVVVTDQKSVDEIELHDRMKGKS